MRTLKNKNNILIELKLQICGWRPCSKIDTFPCTKCLGV